MTDYDAVITQEDIDAVVGTAKSHKHDLIGALTGKDGVSLEDIITGNYMHNPVIVDDNGDLIGRVHHFAQFHDGDGKWKWEVKAVIVNWFVDYLESVELGLKDCELTPALARWGENNRWQLLYFKLSIVWE